MKRLIPIPVHAVTLALLLLAFLIGGSCMTQNSADANSATMLRETANSSESISGKVSNRVSLNHFAMTALFNTRREAGKTAKSFVGDEAWRRAAFDVNLYGLASASSTEFAGQQVTVSSISVDKPFFTLVNDIPVSMTLKVDPPSAASVKVHFLRETMAETFHSVNVIPTEGTTLSPDGTTLTTDSAGTAHFLLQASYGGQGLVWCAFETQSGAALMIDGAITNPRRCDCYCEPDRDCCADSNYIGNKGVELYSGERTQRVTDLTIPGRGFDYQLVRTYRGQASNLRPAATGEFGADWSLSYTDDRLLPDGRNIIVFRGDSLRTDMFIGAGENLFLPPGSTTNNCASTPRKTMSCEVKTEPSRPTRTFETPISPAG